MVAITCCTLITGISGGLTEVDWWSENNRTIAHTTIMALCIICKAAPPDPKKPEHILLNALGGREKTTKALCSRCNNALGSGADKDLADSVQFLRNIANLKSGTGNSAPMIRSINSEGIKFNLESGAKPILKSNGSSLSVEKVDRRIKVEIRASNADQFRELLKGAARKLGIYDSQEIEKFVSHALTNGKAERRLSPCPVVNQNFTFGDGKSKQSMAKSCLALWNELVDNEEVCSSRYDLLRSFIQTDEDSGSHSHLSLCELDYREINDYDKTFESHPNIIWVGSNGSGRVLGYFRLYNIIGCRFELAQKEAPPNRSIYLVSNPFNTNIRKIQEGNFGQISFEWLEKLDRKLKQDPENSTRSLQHFLSVAHDRTRDDFVKDIVYKAWNEADIPEGECLTHDHVKILSEKIAIRLTPSITRKPLTVPLKINKGLT